MLAIDNSALYFVRRNGWFVSTPTGAEGPFTSEEDAIRYADLMRAVSAARGVLTENSRFAPLHDMSASAMEGAPSTS
jgi:hypothetical protein